MGNEYSFAGALSILHEGNRVARAGWNGKGMFLFMVPNWVNVDGRMDPQYRDTQQLRHLPFIAMKTATNEVVPWLASQTDMLAEDWQEVGHG